MIGKLTIASFASLVGVVLSAAPSADFLGFRVAIGGTGMGYLESIAMPLLEKELNDIKVPDVSFDKDEVTVKLQSIECKGFKVGNVQLTPKANEGVTVSATGVSVACSAKWSYRTDFWPHVPYGSGSADITVGGSTALQGEISISNNNENNTIVNVAQCSPSIDITNLHFSGGLSGAILNLLKNTLKGTLEKELKSQLCGALTTVVKTDVDPLFQKFPYSVAACSVVDGSVACDLNLGVGRGQVTPFPVPALPEPDSEVLSNHHIEILLDTYPLNWALWYLFEARIFTFVIDADMIPDAVPIKLNTSFFQDLAPGLAQKYPNMAMQIEIDADSRPLLTTAKTDNGDEVSLKATLPLRMFFQVKQGSEGNVNAFDVSCPVEFSAAPSIKAEDGGKQRIVADAVDLTCTLEMGNTTVGDVDVASLQGLVSFGVSGLLVPKLQQLLGAGFELPSKLGPISLENSTLFAENKDSNDVLAFATNIKYNPSDEVEGTAPWTPAMIVPSLLRLRGGMLR